MSEVSLPPHLLEVLETMSAEMGVPSESLLAQAVFMLARLNGYVVPGKVASGGAGAAAGSSASRSSNGRSAVRRRHEPAEDEEGNPFDQGQEEPPPEEDVQEEPPPEEPQQEEVEEEPPPPPRRGGGGGGGGQVILMMANRDPFKMSGDAVLIGRGKHCDFVIESNRVSREHARISKKGSDLFLEDLGSSNGTFVGPNKEKLTGPKKLKDGDDLTFGTEKVKIAIRR